MMMRKKHLSAIANDVVQRCAQQLNASVDVLVDEFEVGWNPETGAYSRKFVEYCSSKALSDICPNIQEKITDGSFSRLSFDMMLAWDMPGAAEEESSLEGLAKEKEEGKVPVTATNEQEGRKATTESAQVQDEIPLFYSDIMPLLVDQEPTVGEDAFVWLGTLVPLVSDVANGSFTFETLTAPTANRLHFPGYDKFLKEIDKCIRHLQKQAVPKGVELADDEFILHVEGTASSQRVVRHIGQSSWPGRLTLTNYALYFEASRSMTYEDALKIDLSKNIEHSVTSAATGPWGAPLFDKAIIYESPEMYEHRSEGIVLEFPELTSSTRRDHWLSLTKEIMLMHRFLSKFKVDSPTQTWEVHARTILGIIRLHAAREMLRITPPLPTKFLIFSLFEELPKGDYVLEELAESLKSVNTRHPCSASSILTSMNVSQLTPLNENVKETGEESMTAFGEDENKSSLESAIHQVREEAKETDIAKATAEGIKEEGITESASVLMELLSPLKGLIPWFQDVLAWERPAATLILIAIIIIVAYKEWVGKAIAGFLFGLVLRMLQVKKERIRDRQKEIVVCTGSDTTTVESIVTAQHGMQTLHEIIKSANITILKIRSIFLSRTQKHSNTVISGLIGLAVLIAVIPIKLIIIGATLYTFTMTSKLGKRMQSSGGQGDRRLREWWDSIPITHVRVVDRLPESPKNK